MSVRRRHADHVHIEIVNAVGQGLGPEIRDRNVVQAALVHQLSLAPAQIPRLQPEGVAQAGSVPVVKRHQGIDAQTAQRVLPLNQSLAQGKRGGLYAGNINGVGRPDEGDRLLGSDEFVAAQRAPVHTELLI